MAKFRNRQRCPFALQSHSIRHDLPLPLGFVAIEFYRTVHATICYPTASLPPAQITTSLSLNTLIDMCYVSSRSAYLIGTSFLSRLCHSLIRKPLSHEQRFPRSKITLLRVFMGSLTSANPYTPQTLFYPWYSATFVHRLKLSNSAANNSKHSPTIKTFRPTFLPAPQAIYTKNVLLAHCPTQITAYASKSLAMRKGRLKRRPAETKRPRSLLVSFRFPLEHMTTPYHKTNLPLHYPQNSAMWYPIMLYILKLCLRFCDNSLFSQYQWRHFPLSNLSQFYLLRTHQKLGCILHSWYVRML